MQMEILMVLGLMMAAYSVIANDSVQTLGTFIESNKNVKWQWQWLGASAIFVFTILISWFMYNGDISHQRLDKIPFQAIEWYHLLGPAVLLILTFFGIPVSTTFMVLSLFAGTVVLEKMLVKSFMGYGLAAVIGFVLWIILNRFLDEHAPVKDERRRFWRIAQWLTTGFLWYTWLSHDVANIAVFAPRDMGIGWVALVLVVGVGLLGRIFYVNGGKIQKIVMEKTNTQYVRSATIIDLIYAFVLLFFKQYNDIPMSTTWVFVGLLCGRELAINYVNEKRHKKTVFPVVAKDFVKIMFGLGVSVAVALAVHYFCK